MTLSPLADLLSRKRLLLFDLDGTLVDSSPLHARAFAETFAPEGVAVHYPDIAGMTTADAVDKLAGAGGVALAPGRREQLIAAKKARALELIDSELAAIEGATEFVQAARERFPLALCTSASRRGAEATLARVGLEGVFEPIVTGDDVARGKPDPECFLAALAWHRAAPEDALVFEDAQSGLEAAHAAGIEAVRVVPSDGRESERDADWAMLGSALAELGR
jgi:HAD superfamily hydrolase (TIGR01509 family)